MNTRLARYCDRVVEACWLAALLLTPLFFNVYSSRVFEPDKLTLLRSVTIVMAVAWLIGRLDQGKQAAVVDPAGAPVGTPLGRFWRSLTSIPFVPSVLALVVVYLFATLISVAPKTSFWGSYQRLQGTYTTLTYIVIFAITWHSLRTRAQLDRLLNIVVVTSLPIALYGVLQHYGLDPLPWGGNVVDRVTGNLGNAIFIAAYLILAFFITVERAVSRFGRLLREPGANVGDAFMGGAYLFVLALQLMAIFFSKSRGPWLGLLMGSYFFALIALVAMRRKAEPTNEPAAVMVLKATLFALGSLLVAVVPAYIGMILAKRGRRWLWLSLCEQALLAVAFLVVFNLPNTPLAALKQVPGIGRLGQITETDSGTGRVRTLIWEGAVDMLTHNPVRALVGWGPEGMYVAYNPYYPPDLAHYESRNASPDRSHNETFDALIGTGLIGFLVYISLYISIFYFGLRWLGFLPDAKEDKGRRRAVFLGLTIGGGVLGVLLPLLVDHSLRFIGVGIPVGLIVGVALYLAGSAIAGTDKEGTFEFGARELLITALLAMIVAHFVEIHFGIAIAATRVYFWVGLALLLSIGSRRLNLNVVNEASAQIARPANLAMNTSRRRRHDGRRAPLTVPPSPERPASPYVGAVTAGLLGALLVGTFLFCFITNTDGDTQIFRVVWNSLTRMRVLSSNTPLSSLGALFMLLLTWLLGAILYVGEVENAEHKPEGNERALGLLLYLGLSLGLGLLYALFHASQLQTEKDLGRSVFYYYGFAGIVILALAAYLPRRRLVSAPLLRGSSALVYPVLIVLGVLMIASNATIVRADVYYKQAWDGYHVKAEQGLASGAMTKDTAVKYFDSAAVYYQLALHYAPDEDYYMLFLGKALLERGEITTDAQVRTNYLTEAEKVLTNARGLNPLNTDHTANLARLNLTWSGVLSDPGQKLARQQTAAQYFQQAAKLSPHNAELYLEWAKTLIAMGNEAGGLEKLDQALKLDDRYVDIYKAYSDYYVNRGQADKALPYLEKAAAIAPKDMEVRSYLGYAYAQLNRMTEAISETLKVHEAYPKDYQTLKNLAILYSDTKQIGLAIDTATDALQVAPDSDKQLIGDFIARLKAGQQEAKP